MAEYTTSRSSPVSDVPNESAFRSLTMRDKALLKRNINRHHNNNFKAGYVPVHEQSLHKTGLRGRKTYAFWTLVMLLFVLALGNLLLTFVLLGVLRLGQGMESLEIVPEESLIKFYGNTDLDQVYKRDGRLEGFGDSPVDITGDNGSVLINLINLEGGKGSTKIELGPSGTTIAGVNSFDVREPNSERKIFSTNFPNFGLPRGVGHLDVKMARTRRITSPINSSLHLNSDTIARLHGSEGTHMEGKEIIWSADQDITLRSINGSVILSGREGVSIDIKNIPIATGGGNGAVTSQFKICVCMPQGKLFRVPVTENGHANVGCHNIDLTPANNPCM